MAVTIQPYLRPYNYAKDFYEFVYDIYTTVYPAFRCTYYSIDWKNTVADLDILNAGSYEKYGIGELSGFKWKKILLLPIFNVQSIQPSYTADEMGLTLKATENTSFSFPHTFGLRPFPWDFIHFEQFYIEKGSDFSPLFVVKNVELSTYSSTKVFYNIQIGVTGVILPEIEPHVSETYMFLEFAKKIYRADNAKVLLQIESRSANKSNVLKEYFNIRTNTYLKEP